MTKFKMILLLSILITLELICGINYRSNINILDRQKQVTDQVSVNHVESYETLVVTNNDSYEEEYEFNYFGLTEDELNLVYAVVMQEGGPSYESAAAVMSTIINRVNNPKKWSWAGTTIIEQIKYPQQYCYSLDNYWKQYLNGNVPETVKNAVKSVIEFGPVNDYDCFRGYYLEDCEQIADNWYFIG